MGRSVFALWLLALTILGGGLRWAVAERTFPVILTGDEVYYLQVSTHIARRGGHLYDHPSEGRFAALRPPLHSLLLAPFVATGPGAERMPWKSFLWPLVAVEVVLGTLLVTATGLLALALFGQRIALLAAAATALYPSLVAQSHMLWATNLFALLVTGALAVGVSAGDRGRLALAAAGGLLCGLAALTRELGLGVAGALGLWWIATAAPGRRAHALRQAALCTALALLVIAPWTWRNQRVLGGFVPISHIGWFAAAEGNTFEAAWLAPYGPERREFRRSYFAVEGELARAAHARRYTLERVAVEQPGWLAKKLLRNGALLLSPESPISARIDAGHYRGTAPFWEHFARASHVGSYLAVATLGLAGIAGAAGRGRRLLPALLLGGVVLLHVLANATARFRIPWMPLLIVYASYAVIERRALRARLRGGALVACALAWLFLWGWCVPYALIWGRA